MVVFWVDIFQSNCT